MSAAPLLSVENLSVTLPHQIGTVRAVRDVSFSIGRGETLCLVGESGCGKSMTAMAILDLLPASATRTATAIRFAGEDLATASQRRLADLRGDRISMIFQEPMTALNPTLTVGEQLREVWNRHRPKEKGRAEARALEVLGRVGIAGAKDRLRQYPHQLSGGLRQRVMIAIALMCEPELIIADEPTTALDVTIQAQILRLLAGLKDDFGLSLLLITHDLAVASRVADRLIVMYAGQIVEQASSADFFTDPRHPYAKGLLRCLPSHEAAAERQPLTVIRGTVPNLAGALEGCTFRDRCDWAHDPCRLDVPLFPLPPARSCRCVLVPEGARP